MGTDEQKKSTSKEMPFKSVLIFVQTYKLIFLFFTQLFWDKNLPMFGALPK